MSKLIIERINHTGDGVGKIDGKVYFVPKTVVGDVVKIRGSINYRKYAYASIDYFIKKSRNRIKVNCPYYDLCGGCQILGLSYDKQLEYKKNKVIDIFKKYGDMNIEPEIISGNQYKYRNKIILQVDESKLGLVKNRTNNIVNVDYCLLVSDNINEIINVLNNEINLNLVNKVMIREASNGILVAFDGNIDRREVVDILGKKVNSVYVNDNYLCGDKFICQELGEYKFNISYNSFFQINSAMTKVLYDKILMFLGKNRGKVLDLYCGTGTIGIYVSKNVESVLGIEINSLAVKDARKNKKLNKIENISFKCGDVSKLIKNDCDYDVVIVDPPRSGLDDHTRKVILDIGSNTIIYVSCNPITLVRDLNDFKEMYELKDITLVDMFPNTYHVECCMLLSLKEK